MAEILGQDSQTFSIKIHNGRKNTIGVEKITEFDQESIFGRFYRSRSFDTVNIFEQLGDWSVDFTNVHDWAKEIPDIDPRSARVFTFWAENLQTGKIVAIVRGFYIIMPFTLDKTSIYDYYALSDDTPYYPMAIISSIRTPITDEKQIDELLDRLRKAISLNWEEVRKFTIKKLPKDSKLWKRYVFSFPDVIHFTIVCPSADREIIDALNRQDYRMTGLMQIFSSPSPSYDEATIRHHLRSAQEIIDDYPR